MSNLSGPLSHSGTSPAALSPLALLADAGLLPLAMLADAGLLPPAADKAVLMGCESESCECPGASTEAVPLIAGVCIAEGTRLAPAEWVRLAALEPRREKRRESTPAAAIWLIADEVDEVRGTPASTEPRRGGKATTPSSVIWKGIDSASRASSRWKASEHIQ